MLYQLFSNAFVLIHVLNDHSVVLIHYSVIKRLITMLSQAARLEASHSAAITQARNANAELTRRIEREASEVRLAV